MLELEESRIEQITAETYTRRELIDLAEGKIEITQFDKDSRIKGTNMLEGITEVVFSLDLRDNTNNRGEKPDIGWSDTILW